MTRGSETEPGITFEGFFGFVLFLFLPQTGGGGSNKALSMKVKENSINQILPSQHKKGEKGKKNLETMNEGN